MLFRLVRPMRRSGSRNRYYVRRIPSDVKARAVGMSFAVPVGERTEMVTITARTQAVRLSLRTDDPAEVKSRQSAIDAQLETIWGALREDRPAALTQRQATALAGELYRVWADGEERERTTAIEQDPHVQFNAHREQLPGRREQPAEATSLSGIHETKTGGKAERSVMPYTRGQMLRDCIAFALRGVKLQLGKRFVPLKLTEEQRYAVGDEVVRKLREPWKLDEDMPENLPGPRV